MRWSLAKSLVVVAAIGAVGVGCCPACALAVAAPSPRVGRAMIPDAIDQCPGFEKSAEEHALPAEDGENCDPDGNR